jgi:hypothetical protein
LEDPGKTAEKDEYGIPNGNGNAERTLALLRVEPFQGRTIGVGALSIDKKAAYLAQILRKRAKRLRFIAVVRRLPGSVRPRLAR